MTSTLSETRSIGRPRNEDADVRILNAALELYGEAGWSGFNLTRVAALAGVGKSSMYSRWSEREDLLLDAFKILIPMPGPVGDTVWDILVNEATYRVKLYLGPHATALRRLFVEVAGDEPVIVQAYDNLYVEPIATIKARLWEFKSGGLLPSSVSVTRMVDAIEGSILMRGFSIPKENLPCFLTEIPEYVEALVLDQLRVPLDAPRLKLVHDAH
ncbi:helix-turn-helix transcriptional regulator [Arcanobacterium haemolyticum]|nr:helix-turn-helix transcriptional regulator [Arcanobacterium haemolyticum]